MGEWIRGWLDLQRRSKQALSLRLGAKMGRPEFADPTPHGSNSPFTALRWHFVIGGASGGEVLSPLLRSFAPILAPLTMCSVACDFRVTLLLPLVCLTAVATWNAETLPLRNVAPATRILKRDQTAARMTVCQEAVNPCL